MGIQSPSLPGSRERWLAALAHISVLAIFIGIPLIPVVILIINGRNSKWVSFHAWQAIIYQLALASLFIFLAIILFVSCYSGITSTVCIDRFGGRQSIPVTLWLFIVCGPLLLFSFSLFGGVRLLIGKEFGYPLISNLLRKKLKME